MAVCFLRYLLLIALFASVIPLVFSSPDEIKGATKLSVEARRNAQRQALGLPPVRSNAGEKRAQPVEKIPPLSPERQATFSAAQKTTGYIAVYQESLSGTLLGYLTINKVAPTMAAATKYIYTTSGSLLEFSVASSTNMHMCVAAGFYGQTLGTGSKNFHLPRYTLASTAPGATPFHDPDTALYTETTVFSLDSSGEIHVKWINPDNGLPSTHITIHDGIIFYTGDLTAFQNYIGSTVDVVVFKWVADT